MIDGRSLNWQNDTDPSSFLPSSSLTLIVLLPFNMATNKPLLLSAIVGSKLAIAITTLFSADRFLGIEVEGDIENGKKRVRSQYSVRLSVADKEVAKSTNKPVSFVLKWEWIADNEMWVSFL